MHFVVRVECTLSNIYDHDQCISQGSILSVTLFSIKLNSLSEVLLLFVDDFNVSCRSKNVHSIERHLQLCLNKFTDLSERNGFEYSI